MTRTEQEQTLSEKDGVLENALQSGSGELVPWSGAESPSALIAEVQAALEAGELTSWEQLSPAMQLRLRTLAQRLERVRSWGGAFSEIELSPQLEGLLLSASQSYVDAQGAVLTH